MPHNNTAVLIKIVKTMRDKERVKKCQRLERQGVMSRLGTAAEKGH
jgi:hypothetical protein